LKKYITVFVLLTATVAGATLISVQQSNRSNDPMKEAPDIVIARCTTELDRLTTNKIIGSVVGGNGFVSDIEIISVLKGSTKIGPSQMMLERWPYPDEQFLLLANYDTNHFFKDNQSLHVYDPGHYQVVPLPRFFRTNILADKTVDEQILWLLKIRLKEVNEEIARANEEKELLEKELNEATNMQTGGPLPVRK
jgi:hypothetical protein